MLGDIGPLEIGIVLVIALLVFGPKKLPELGHGLGKGMREFKDGVTGKTAEPAPTQITAGTTGTDSVTSTNENS